jgi:hypothetical protein
MQTLQKVGWMRGAGDAESREVQFVQQLLPTGQVEDAGAWYGSWAVHLEMVVMELVGRFIISFTSPA